MYVCTAALVVEQALTPLTRCEHCCRWCWCEEELLSLLVVRRVEVHKGNVLQVVLILLELVQ